MREPVETIFPLSSSHLPQTIFGADRSAPPWSDADSFIAQVERLAESAEVPAYLPDLGRAERARHESAKGNLAIPLTRPETMAINPTLAVTAVGWQPLLALLDGADLNPEPAAQVLLFWLDPESGRPEMTVASAAELLALKIVAEGLDAADVAKQHDRPVGTIDAVIDDAIRKGLLLAPPTRLRRDASQCKAELTAAGDFTAAEVFTLQWHITQRCDLHCRHCYDRSMRKDVELEQGLQVLDQMRRFCRDHLVDGQVSFSGGNPFLHPAFPQLYQAALERNLSVAILGNPVSEAELDAILKIGEPAFFQVSLEGLEQHNDYIRGKGSYQAVLGFLDLLREKQVYSMVMMTLTRANLDQALPLAEMLKDRVDMFTYNRLAMTGEGASLESPQPDEYRRFVNDWLRARRTNPALALKDSLINIELERQGLELFGGCTGFGCGAAFNFVSLLPDGQVHACRKLPSMIGNLNRQSLEEIYYSTEAERYRQGCLECSDCHLRLVCGGCLAVAHGWGLDPLTQRDPDCFKT